MPRIATIAIVSTTGSGEPELSPEVVPAAARSTTRGARFDVAAGPLVSGGVTGVGALAVVSGAVVADVVVPVVVDARCDPTVTIGALVAGGGGAVVVVVVAGEAIAALGRRPGFA